MKALLYCRTPLAADGTSAPSIAEQEELLVGEATDRGLEFVVFKDEVSESGDGDRLAEALELLDEHQADVLMAVRLDWIFDSDADVQEMVDRSKRKGWGIILSGDNVDSSSPDLFGTHLKAVATAEERAIISRRTREAMQRQKAEGALFGRPVDPGFIATYREVLAMVNRGMSYNAVARTLNDQGIATAKGRTWYASTIKAMVESETARRIGQPRTG
jgi:DNA invertase Pin-like site-specific DNA recombinase